jgi:hypothetical protein
MTAQFSDHGRWERVVNAVERVVLAACVEDRVVDAAVMLRSLLRIVVRGLALPDDLVDEVLLAEE